MLCHPSEGGYDVMLLPFWNHILANLANLSMCLLKSRDTSAVCTWGLKGDFIFRLIFVVLFSHGAVCCFVAVISPTTVPTLILLCFGMTREHLPHHFSEWPRAHLPHPQHWPSAITPPGDVSLSLPFNPSHIIWLHWLKSSLTMLSLLRRSKSKRVTENVKERKKEREKLRGLLLFTVHYYVFTVHAFFTEKSTF